MCRFYFFLFLAFEYSYASNPVAFPQDTSSSNTPNPRTGWLTLGEKYKTLKVVLSRIQTPSSAPTTTEEFETPLLTFPPLSMQTFPPPPSFSTGVLEATFEPGAASETAATVIEASRCECLPVGLCTNTTTRDEATTRIVTRPPAGTICGLGEVYCCIETVKLGCGIPNVVPGVIPKEGQADLGEFPWSAVILNTDDVYVGGGILIDSSHILTAAHKVAKYGNGAGLKIRLGDWDLTNEEEPVGYLEVKVSKIVNHPRFEATSLKNDISVITLATPVSTLTRPYPQINTICLPEPTAIFTGSRCKVAGWGKDQFDGQYQSIIKKVDLPVLSNADCQTKLRNTRLGNSFVLDTNSFICAGGEASKDACTGDGGTALACLKDGQYYLAGITAGGIECGNENVPGLYVNMVNYLTWVNAQISGSVPGIDPRRKPT